MSLVLTNDRLSFEFPEVHPHAVLEVQFQRTLRVPDDGRQYNLPPSLGRFPLRAVDDLAPQNVPSLWLKRGGIAMPMWQAEACWLDFRSPHGYPFLLKVAAGKVNAINGHPWVNTPDFADQDYVEVPGQPWLDGFCVAEGVVRQFVAMPLGAGYTAEEQLTGAAEHGGVQLLVHPLKAAAFNARPPVKPLPPPMGFVGTARARIPAMGLAPGGAISQIIERAEEKADDWDLSVRARCFVHLANSLSWGAITGEAPPTVPPTAADYTRAGLPWFDWYSDKLAIARATRLADLRSVQELGRENGETPLPENEGFEPPEPIILNKSNTHRHHQ